MQDAVIVSATRTAVGKAPAGTLRTVRPDDMAAAVINESLRRAPGVDAKHTTPEDISCAALPHVTYLLRRKSPRAKVDELRTRLRARLRRLKRRSS